MAAIKTGRSSPPLWLCQWQPATAAWLLAAFAVAAALAFLNPLRSGCPNSGTATPVSIVPPRFTVPPQPTKASFLRLEADPGLLQQEPALLTEFQAAPWLLPPRTALPYAGVHDLDTLLALRAAPVMGHDKVVALVGFSVQVAELVQNCVYTMVKFGGVGSSYVLLTWTEADLAACADLNLPCADVTSLLPVSLDPAEDIAPETPNFYSVTWMRPVVAAHCLELGYVVAISDADISYARKPLFESLLTVVHHNEADGVFQAEGPFNTGMYLLLPTPGSKTTFKSLARLAPAAAREEKHEQFEINDLQNIEYNWCNSGGGCKGMREKMNRLNSTIGLFRTVLPAYYHSAEDACAMNQGLTHPEWVHADPCDSTALFMHASCVNGKTNKAFALLAVEWWYMDYDMQTPCAMRKTNTSKVPICYPRQWRIPQAELHQYLCHPKPYIGLTLSSSQGLSWDAVGPPP